MTTNARRLASFKTITVADLIALLQDEDPEARIILGANYGDRRGTLQALPIRGRTEEVLIEESAYSDSGFAVVEDDVDNDHETFLLLK